MNKLPKDKKQREHYLLRKHSRYLRCMTNLAQIRQNELDQTIQDHGLSNKVLKDDDLTSGPVRIATAKKIGGLRTGMRGDASEEIQKYHYGPLQIAYCLLYAMIEKHKKLVKVHPLFKDKHIDKYYASNEERIQLVKDLRHSLLHEYPDNVEDQKTFLLKFDGTDTNDREFLRKGQAIFEGMLMRTQALLPKTEQKRNNAENKN